MASARFLVNFPLVRSIREGLQIGGDHVWEAIGAIGEVIGGAAVIASIIYLAVPTRINARATPGLVRRQVADSSQQVYLTGVESPELSSLVMRAFTGEGELEAAERPQMTRFAMAVFLNFEVQFHQYRSGWYDEWETVLALRISTILEHRKFVREWRESGRSGCFSESFSRAVGDLVASRPH